MNFTYNTKHFNTKHLNKNDEEEEEEIMEETNIITKGNEIYYYGDINKNEILKLITHIKDLNTQLQIQSILYNFQPCIHLHLYSNGGDAFMGLSGYDFIKANPIPIYTYIDGMIASAATFIYLAGHRRFMSENATVLIHQISTTFWGKFEDLKDEYKNTDELMKIVKRIYNSHTTMKKKQLDEILKRELLLTYNDCTKINFYTN